MPGPRTEWPEVGRILAQLGITAARTRPIPANHGLAGNANWHVWPKAGDRCVLRRYYAGTTPEDLEYEHTILARLSGQGWCVPDPLAPPVEADGRWYCLTRYVPGRSRAQQTPDQHRQRGVDLARLHVALRPLAGELGQRPGWRPLRHGLPVMVATDWPVGLEGLADEHPALAEWATVAAASTASELAGTELPLTVIHGDFMGEENVHYSGARLAGVIDFGVAHLGSRPYELVSARCHRAPELVAGYAGELGRLGWGWSELEQAALPVAYRGFRLGMVAWLLDAGLRTGVFDAVAIEGQLERTGVDPSGTVVPIILDM